MTRPPLFRLWLATALVMLPIDAVWLTLMAQPFYRVHIGHLMAPDFALGPAIAFYLLYVSGIVLLAQRNAASWREAAKTGAILGLVAYGTYDLTNEATLQGWPTIVTVVDLIWGTFLTGTTAGLGFLFASRVASRSAP
jgi:uncharacterized membrane protein